MNADPFNFAIMVRLHLKKFSGKKYLYLFDLTPFVKSLLLDCYYLQRDGEGTVHSVYTRDEIVSSMNFSHQRHFGLLGGKEILCMGPYTVTFYNNLI